MSHRDFYRRRRCRHCLFNCASPPFRSQMHYIYIYILAGIILCTCALSWRLHTYKLNVHCEYPFFFSEEFVRRETRPQRRISHAIATTTEHVSTYYTVWTNGTCRWDVNVSWLFFFFFFALISHTPNATKKNKRKNAIHCSFTKNLWKLRCTRHATVLYAWHSINKHVVQRSCMQYVCMCVRALSIEYKALKRWIIRNDCGIGNLILRLTAGPT